MLYNKSISEFQYIYDMLINESKNVPVPDKLVQNILSKFEYKNKIVYRKSDLIQLNTDYQYLSKHSKYTLTVFMINPEDVEKTFSKSNFREFINTNKNDLIEGLKVNHGIYVPLRNDTGYLILNYQDIKDNPNILNDVIKHELTHYFDKTQNKNNKWKDLIDLGKSPDEYTYKQKMATFILSLLGYTMKDIQYLGSANEFEAFCTSIEEHKNEFDKNVLNNITEYITTDKLKEQPKHLRNLYLFMFVNMAFDESAERIKYIRKHLN